MYIVTDRYNKVLRIFETLHQAKAFRVFNNRFDWSITRK